MELHLVVIWIGVSFIVTGIRGAILSDDGRYTPVVVENPYWGVLPELTLFGNILTYTFAIFIELVFLPYIICRWTWNNIIFKTGKSVLIKRTINEI
jgi:hypothetical protein